MKKKEKTEALDFDTLKSLGFVFEAPEGEFSYQPDSGGTAAGIIGRQEYGIDEENQTNDSVNPDETQKGEDSTIPIPGESNWSQGHRAPQQEIGTPPINKSDNFLTVLIKDRFVRHPKLSQIKVVIEVKDGIVTLKGKALHEATKLLMSEIVESLPGVVDIRNELTV